MTDLKTGPWPWPFDPGKEFKMIAWYARILAGFPREPYGISDETYQGDPSLLSRDVTMILVIALRRAERAGVTLDLDRVIADAGEELERWKRRSYDVEPHERERLKEAER
jgi:hypothetical protein